MTHFIGTNTAKRIMVDEYPDVTQFTIEDIATGLANTCRFGGQLQTWYSVAEHSIHVAELVPPQYRLQALMHDASEAYIGDIPTPLKLTLGTAYTDIETRLNITIGSKFGLNLITLHESVKLADKMMAVSERDAFQQTPVDWGPNYEDVVRYPNLKRVYATPTAAREAFLNAFKRYQLEHTLQPI